VSEGASSSHLCRDRLASLAEVLSEVTAVLTGPATDSLPAMPLCRLAVLPERARNEAAGYLEQLQGAR
jgi:hypothetical protein